jgi:ABC-type antimicrobial peptide transport system permease subunit
MDQLIGKSALNASFDATLMVAFSVLSLILAAVGLFGVLSYIVAQRTHEIGIRVALGAQKNDVLRLIIGQGMFPALLGLGIGVAGAFGLMRLLASLLYGVKPTDPQTFVTVSVTLAVVAMLASYIPARHAAQVDPMVALRHE